MSILLSCPNIEDKEDLYSIFTSISGNEEKTIDDFYDFLSKESSARALFLNEYCKYTLVTIENSVILKYQKK